MARDSAGNVFVADPGTATVRRITPQGLVTTFTGSASKTGDDFRENNGGTGGLLRLPSGRLLATERSGIVAITLP